MSTHKVTVYYSTDNDDVNESIKAIIDNTLPFMVDNVSYEIEELN